MANTLEWVLGIIAVISLLMIFTGHLDLNISLQSVVGTDCPPFKTNAVGTYPSGGFYQSNVWIAADCDKDGIYEKYGYNQYGGSGEDPSTIPEGFYTVGRTAENYVYACVVNNYLRVFDTSRTGPCYGNPYCYAFFDTTSASAANADTSCGSSSTCRTDADTDCNNQVSLSELSAYTVRWKQGQVSLTLLSQATTAWKQG